MKRNRNKSNKNGFEEWGGYMEAKKLKLEQQFASKASERGIEINNIFKDIAIFVNGLTEPSADELRFLMMKHGGQYHHYYSNERTTHVIASNLPDSKVKQLKNMKVVKPQWIVDSIEAGKVLDYKDYLLYTNESRSQPKLSFKLSTMTKDLTPSNGISFLPSYIKESTSAAVSVEKTSPSKLHSAAKNAIDSKFLSEFYSNSRLHLISTMGTTFKEYINKLRSIRRNEFPGLDELRMYVNEKHAGKSFCKFSDECEDKIEENIIMHIDMDCFFVSVGIRNKPHLKGTPIAVTHAKGNNVRPRDGTNSSLEKKLYLKKYEEKNKGSIVVGKDHWTNTINESDSMAEIASCNYEARKFGVKNGMFFGQALKLCQHLKTLPYDFEGYKEVSFLLYDTVARYTLKIEAVSCDEMFVDCSEILSATSATVIEFATVLRKEIKEKTGCPCSTGFGYNRLQARLATKRAKPDGIFHLKLDHVSEFMNTINVSDLPGVGRSTTSKLHSIGIQTCSDLQLLSLHKLQSEFGNKLGEMLFKNSRGLDEKGLVFTSIRKSVSAEVNYGIRFQNDTDRDKFLKQLSEEVSSRLAEIQMKGKCITLKIMVRSKEAPEESAKYLGHGMCDNITKSCSLSSPECSANLIYREVLKIINNLNVKAKELRGIGIQISRLESNAVFNNSLKKYFDQNEEKKIMVSEPKIIGRTDKLVDSLTTVKEVNGPSTSKDRTSKFDVNLANVSISQVDPSFLDALPENLKNEIIYSLVSKKQGELERKASTEKNMDARKDGGCKEFIASIIPQNESQRKDDDKNYISPDEMKTMIKEWVKTEESPNPCDVDMFGEYLQHMVISHQIQYLHVLLKFFYRCLLNQHKSSAWKEAYSLIIDRVQVSMLREYRGRLMIKEKFKDIGRSKPERYH